MGQGSVLFWGEISPNFDLNNLISNYAKDFSWEKKKSQIRQISKEFFSKLPDFKDKFQ
jgi:hypothetical protein